MGGQVERTGTVAARAPRYRRLVLLLSVAVMTLGLGFVWFSTPRFYLWVNGEKVAEAKDPSVLRESLVGWGTSAVTRSVTLEHGGQTWNYRMEELGMVVPMAAGEEELERILSRRRWWQRVAEVRLDLPVGWEISRMESALEPVREAAERDPVSAAMEPFGSRVTVVPSQEGVRVDTEGLRRILETHRSGPITVPLVPVAPAMSTEAVKQLGVRRLIAEWSTEYDPAIPRAENVERAARSFDGLLLKPGEILSYNGVVGPIDAAAGWQEAWVIVGGELVTGIGGGVCQVATTLYGAALRADLEILERHPHQLAVSYIPPSEDAAVAQGYQDLKIRNSTSGHLLLRTETAGGRVTFRIYGDLPEGLEVRIESRVTGSIPFPTRLVNDPNLPPGERLTTRGGVAGLSSQAYRVVLVDGKEVRRELLSRDRYQPTAEVIRIGPAAPGAGQQTPPGAGQQAPPGAGQQTPGGTGNGN